MNISRFISERWLRLTGVMAAGILLTQCSTSVAQLPYSFETGLQGWSAADPNSFPGTDVVNVTTSTMGATDGLQSMEIETAATFGWDATVSVDPNGTPSFYSDFNAVAADESQFNLEFDVTTTASSNLTGAGFFLINVSANDDNGAFPQVFNVTPNLMNTTSTFPVSIPMTDLPLLENSSFFQLNIGSNSNHSTGNAKYFVDNVRFTQAPQLVPETIFSWETPALDGWTEGFEPGHSHSQSGLGATDGSSSLQINRQSVPSGFSWGSRIVLESDTNPDPNIEVIDPNIQAQIDDIIDKVNGAEAIAFDVRFDDSAPFTPTFTKFGVHLQDGSGNFYQAEGQSFNGLQSIGTTGTVTIPLSSIADGGTILGDVGLVEGSNFLQIGISTNTDGGGIYQIDNFRVLSELVTDNADFDGDGFVTGADFLIYQRNIGLGGQTDNSNGDANGDGVVDGADLSVWDSQYGSAPPLSGSISSVPEPSSICLTLFACTLLSIRTRRFGS